MAVDQKRLVRDIKKLRQDRSRNKVPGTTEAVRSALPTIYRLRAGGYLWKEIAQALGEQGVVQGQGSKQIPITTGRLTALVRQLEVQAPKSKGKQSRRSTEPRSNRKRIRLAPELTQKARETGNPPLNEQDIRQAEFDKHAHLLKKR